MGLVNHGITPTTPENILLGAGVYYKGLKWADGAWTGTVLGATSGGGKLSIKGELIDIEVDGALVKVKGLTVKQGGAASIETTMVEITTDNIKLATMFKESESDVEGYTLLEDKAHIEEGDYVDDFAFVGKTADGKKDIVVVFESALCTSGLELEPKGKEASLLKLTMEAYAKIDGDLSTIPVKIYYPIVA